ncbi:HPr(Ser) kinase/phosphatase [Clostridium tagluense]|uniref:HPr kinase/phosphorylase n=1 Tax=Clostridium tagluense TaxID=360422 RepID=A0A401UQL8_9CLOT|nr:HPr(Ser) kinase/phosphatase [Clostridium tagluense]MCB2311541.1 HPr(Ser) kinase/phosphatase [Clostridium tagluense]MCB2316265.1 HPr(Ser) kinase/phosphatase [Clostridium tagluense]MCB2321119.1 HPr(Ser) kinase/phosphatase [Clostridium tagluense]MCB2326134.1 HPr(Ser) kinase/phosphatase [Clostridium tagluense]MCB2330857.1 HPr(Ser) kinase/phosphatase [Clostridium tagluense]
MDVTIEELIENFKLEVLVQGEKGKLINVSDINRPGLQIAGFYQYFDNKRVQLIGMAEWGFLDCMEVELRKKRINKYFKLDPFCVIFTRDLEPHTEILKAAQENGTWILRTKLISTRFISKLTNFLDTKLAPETRLHGVLVDVYGIGILLSGESGIGKSECALELIKRGHRLIADDAVDIKEIDGVLLGSCPYITSGMLEVRGMGIIDIPAIYGMSSVLNTKTISIYISLTLWNENEEYDRLGIDNEFMDILNVPLRKITLPIRPGRNIAVIIEAAAANYRYSLNSKITPVETINMRIEEVTAARNN